MTPGSQLARHRWKRQVGRLAALLVLLAGCATQNQTPPSPPEEAVSLPEPQRTAPLAQLQAYAVSPGIGTQCVPYARARTGIGIFGDAYTWWDTAAGRYARGRLPVVGSVLVLRKTSRLRYGHVSVVTGIVSPREIRIDHANWQPDAIITDMAGDRRVAGQRLDATAILEQGRAGLGPRLPSLRVHLQCAGQRHATQRHRHDDHLRRRQHHLLGAAAAAHALTSSRSRRARIARGSGRTSPTRCAPCCNRMPSRCARGVRR